MTDRSAAPLPRRVLQTFVAPRDLFQGFREHAPWVGPLLIILAVQLLMVAALPDEAFRESVEGAVTRRGEPVTITSDLETIARYGRLLGMLSALVYVPLAALVSAGILALLFSFVLRGEGTVRQYLAVVTHAGLITALGALVALALSRLRGGEVEPVSPALLLPFLDPEGLAYRILAGVDLFTVWALVVAALGVSMVNRRRSWAGAAAILLGLYFAAVVALAAVGA